jgi:mono/diheme cytochrome c family protein
MRMKGRTALLVVAGLMWSSISFAQSSAPAASGAAGSGFKVVDGNQVDGQTLLGWRTWRALDCERCHGAQQQGLVGPSLIDAFKTLDKTEFHRTVFGGRLAKGMPDFSSSKMMQQNWENLYGYLKARSDGKVKPGDLHAIGAQ